MVRSRLAVWAGAKIGGLGLADGYAAAGVVVVSDRVCPPVAPHCGVQANRLQCAVLGNGSRPVSRVLSWTAIHLGRRSPAASCSLPAGSAGRLNACLFGLAPGGVCPPQPLPVRPCALTARFHPCLSPPPAGQPRADARDPIFRGQGLGLVHRKVDFAALRRQSPGHRRYVSVALSVALGPCGLAAPRCYLAPCPVEPGLSSARDAQRLSGRLPRTI